MSAWGTTSFEMRDDGSATRLASSVCALHLPLHPDRAVRRETQPTLSALQEDISWHAIPESPPPSTRTDRHRPPSDRRGVHLRAGPLRAHAPLSALTSATAALTLSKRNTMATLDVDGELQPGATELVVGAVVADREAGLVLPMRIPFFVSDSKASIPSRLRRA